MLKFRGHCSELRNSKWVLIATAVGSRATVTIIQTVLSALISMHTRINTKHKTLLAGPK